MDIHEYQAKQLLADYGVPIPRGGLAYSPEQAAYRARELGGNRWAVKAQIHSGGRGKAGGIILCDDEHAVWDAADALLGKRLVTEQTGAAGKLVHRLYVETVVPHERELYLGFVLDRRLERVVIAASTQGGVEIEELAVDKPEAIIRAVVEPAAGMRAFQARELAFALNLEPSLLQHAVNTILGCYDAFRRLDATLLEINPLVVTDDGSLMALDAKMAFDENALFRRPAISELRDKSQEDPRETQANDRGLNYVGLDGTIGCVVNGAGLAMATMDMIKLSGGEPANFLDIGGGATPERVAKAIRLVLSDDKVQTVLVNVFAGINRCDWVAEGLVQALRKEPPEVPIVVRLSGTNVEEGRQILADSGLQIRRADTLADAAEQAVQAWNETRTNADSGSTAPQ